MDSASLKKQPCIPRRENLPMMNQAEFLDKMLGEGLLDFLLMLQGHGWVHAVRCLLRYRLHCSFTLMTAKQRECCYSFGKLQREAFSF